MHNEELSVICTLHQVLMVMKSRRMGWAARVAGVDKAKNAYRHLIWNSEGRPFGRPNVDVIVILEMLLSELRGGVCGWIQLAE